MPGVCDSALSHFYFIQESTRFPWSLPGKNLAITHCKQTLICRGKRQVQTDAGSCRMPIAVSFISPLYVWLHMCYTWWSSTVWYIYWMCVTYLVFPIVHKCAVKMHRVRQKVPWHTPHRHNTRRCMLFFYAEKYSGALTYRFNLFRDRAQFANM